MTISRREFLVGTGALAGATVFGVAGPAFGATAVDPRAALRNRLVVIFLEGGNDGLNYVIPRGDLPGAPRASVYRRVRPSLAYKPDATLPLDRGDDAAHLLGLNPKLSYVHSLYRDGRVAVVQGVDYPNHNYSHFASQDIWHTGDPLKSGGSGWLGRHLDRVGVDDGELRAVAVSSRVPLMLQGREPAAAMTSVPAMRFEDGSGAHALDRQAGLATMGAARAGDPLRTGVGAALRQTVDIVGELRKTDAPTGGPSEVANALLTARTLLEQNLGVECVYLRQGGYDTHAAQASGHEQLLGDLDTALEVFFRGTAKGQPVGAVGAMKPELAARTVVMIVSEFGRRIGQAGGGVVAGTDHGAAAPVVLVGPAAGLRGGLHGEHPNMGTTAAPADNLTMTTDLRHLYQAVLQGWLGDPDPIYSDARSGPLRDLFTLSGAAPVRAATARRATSTSSGTRDDGTTTSSLGGRANGPTRVAGKTGIGVTRDGGRAVHPVSAAAALAFNAFVAAVVLRSGRFRHAMADWRGTDLPS